MLFLYFKALHIIFVITWFAGLFYIVRLFIYHVEANEKSSPEREILIKQYTLMEKRLWYMITWPSAILTTIFGAGLLHTFWPVTSMPWLMAKLIFVAFLYLYHFACAKIMKSLIGGKFKYTSTQLRIWNEVATVLMFAIVFLVVLKDLVSLGWGMVALFVFSAILMIGIKIYKKQRKE